MQAGAERFQLDQIFNWRSRTANGTLKPSEAIRNVGLLYKTNNEQLTTIGTSAPFFGHHQCHHIWRVDPNDGKKKNMNNGRYNIFRCAD